MPRSPWKTVRTPDPGREYLALISFLPLRHFRAVPSFFLYALETQRQLRTAKGLLGYSLDAQPFGRRFWTLSVWEDSPSLMDFVRQLPHFRIMQDLAPHMGKSQFVQWKITAADFPPRWEEAKARLP
jgi:hypothetical protein